MATSIKNILTILSNCKSAYEIAVDNGFVGTEQDWLASLGGVESVPPKPIDLRPTALPYPLNMSLEDIQEEVDPSAQKLDISGDDFQTCTHVLSGTDGTWYALPNSLLQPLSLGGKQIFQVVINPAQLITTPSSTPGINAVIALMNSSFDGLLYVSVGSNNAKQHEWSILCGPDVAYGSLETGASEVVITIEIDWDAQEFAARVNGEFVDVSGIQNLPELDSIGNVFAYALVEEFAGITPEEENAQVVVRFITNHTEFIGEVSSGFSPIVDSEINWPPEDVKVGDTFYVTNGGTFQGVEYKEPDEGGNCEGFQVMSLEPLELLVIKPGSSGIPEAPEDGKTYGRQEGDWAEITQKKLKVVQRDVTSFTLTQDDVDAFIHVNTNLAACTITLEEGVFVKGDEIHIIREEKPTGVTVTWIDDLKVNGNMVSFLLPDAYSAITIVCKDDEGKYFTVIGDYECSPES